MLVTHPAPAAIGFASRPVFFSALFPALFSALFSALFTGAAEPGAPRFLTENALSALRSSVPDWGRCNYFYFPQITATTAERNMVQQQQPMQQQQPPPQNAAPWNAGPHLTVLFPTQQLNQLNVAADVALSPHCVTHYSHWLVHVADVAAPVAPQQVPDAALQPLLPQLASASDVILLVCARAVAAAFANTPLGGAGIPCPRDAVLVDWRSRRPVAGPGHNNAANGRLVRIRWFGRVGATPGLHAVRLALLRALAQCMADGLVHGGALVNGALQMCDDCHGTVFHDAGAPQHDALWQGRHLVDLVRCRALRQHFGW